MKSRYSFFSGKRQVIFDAINKYAEETFPFLTEPTAQKSIREQYYQYSPYISEFFCTLSNLGLFAVGFYYQDLATLFAATFSALSHAIPSQRLHDLDMAGVLLIFGKVFKNYKVFLLRPETGVYGAGALMLNMLDTYVTRDNVEKMGPVIHVAWHLAAAFALHKFNQAEIEVTPQELENVSLTKYFRF